MNNSDDKSRCDTGNDLETQACTSTGYRPRRHLRSNQGTMNQKPRNVQM